MNIISRRRQGLQILSLNVATIFESGSMAYRVHKEHQRIGVQQWSPDAVESPTDTQDLSLELLISRLRQTVRGGIWSAFLEFKLGVWLQQRCEDLD